MSVFAIADLHLPGHNDKPMDVFGTQWDRHFEVIHEHWLAQVTQEDIVLIPGDISWAMHLQHALDDLGDIAALPGQKILLRGNHDYWWSSITKVRTALPDTLHALQNDALMLGEQVFCGTRGWNFPTASCPLEEQDLKIYQRELLRLELSLTCAAKIAQGEPFTVLMHFPPLLVDGQATAYTQILDQYPVSRVVYGHLHGSGIKNGFVGQKNGIEYHLVSCDAIGFSPLRIA